MAVLLQNKVPISGPSSLVSRQPRWVLLWGGVGALSLVVVIQGWARWLFSDDFKATHPGPDHFASWKHLYLQVFQWFVFSLALLLVWLLLVRPLLRQRTLTFDGMLVIAFFSAWF